jgi:hypothetical protein
VSRIPRRRVDEIVELHARHGRNLQEVFVEGSEDKYFYENFLRAKGLSHVSVLEINTVEVPTEDVMRIGQSDGNRGRVIALAQLLQDRVQIAEVVCVADADFDHYNRTIHPYRLLLFTDGTSIDVYALNISVIDKLLHTLNGFPKTSVDVVRELDELLKEAFLMRVAASGLAFEGKFPEKHSSFCQFRGGTTQFRKDDYASRAFAEVVDEGWQQKLREKMDERHQDMPDDPRKRVHGHDFRDTLAWYIRQHPPHGSLNPATLSKLLPGLIDVAVLEQEPLFIELLRRLA